MTNLFSKLVHVPNDIIKAYTTATKVASIKPFLESINAVLNKPSVKNDFWVVHHKNAEKEKHQQIKHDLKSEIWLYSKYMGYCKQFWNDLED